MEKRRLPKDSLAGVVQRIGREIGALGPVRDGDNVLFEPLAGREIHLSFANTKNAPKNALFPHTETLVRFLRTPKGMECVADGDEAKKAVLFVRPCDARSFVLLDKLFDQEKYRDPYWVARREASTVVSLACAKPPYSACFCTSVGGEPGGEEGADVLVTDLGADVLVEFLTPKGEALVPYFEGAQPADDAAAAKKEEIRQAAREAIQSQVPGREVKAILDASFEHPFWATLHRSCLACGTCTYLCPTCHCFDISDEQKGADGARIRSWDSCMYPLFTKETSGHNPRSSQKERWRQRVMHKFRYYVDMFDAIACVGCGRCVLNCPVNLDIRKIVSDIAKL